VDGGAISRDDIGLPPLRVEVDVHHQDRNYRRLVPFRP
jgi:hypothetical protein